MNRLKKTIVVVLGIVAAVVLWSWIVSPWRVSLPMEQNIVRCQPNALAVKDRTYPN